MFPFSGQMGSITVFLHLRMAKWHVVRIRAVSGKNSRDFFNLFWYKLWGGGREITKAFQYLGGKDTVQLLISRYKAVEIVF